MKKSEVEKMIFDIFKLCDEYVSAEHFVEFEDKFSTAVNKVGYDLHKIYYGKSYQEMKDTNARYDILK